MAVGTSTSQKRCRGVQPLITPASRCPRHAFEAEHVFRTIGGIA